ncbi:MAG: aminomethyl-transferring glycine dehydrogenase [Deltaproteobacteria bacterium]|nr:aminomethyl-transferring glycine dehydrogenase [Deltaproteobacteria bacterium]
MKTKPDGTLEFTDTFADRHIGPGPDEFRMMLKTLSSPERPLATIDQLIAAVVPARIRTRKPLDIGKGRTEAEALAELRAIAARNDVWRSYLGMGYSGTITPPVIQRNILENPGWYTAYTPYQAEISQGRLEALLNFQTMVIDLTALPIANASLLDEGTAAAEAMTMCRTRASTEGASAKVFLVSKFCHPQTISILKTRAEPVGIELLITDPDTFDFKTIDPKKSVFGALLQYPSTDGAIFDHAEFIEKAHRAGIVVAVATDILSLALLRPPGELGADIAIGSTQRFGVPMGYGGPHAAFLSTKDGFKRLVPGRIVGLSQDAAGRPAARLALQTREQHIRREKATSNICTAQVLLAVISGMYAVYHGPKGIRRIAERVHLAARILAEGLSRLGHAVQARAYFDTVRVSLAPAGGPTERELTELANAKKINLRHLGHSDFAIALDETVSTRDLADLFELFGGGKKPPFTPDGILKELSGKDDAIPASLRRTSSYLTHPVFNGYHSETELLRYLHRLQAKDLSLTTSMIALGSCTMKLNAAAEMYPVTWPEFSALHPFAPLDQARGYQALFRQLEGWLDEITGFSAISLQPNAGSQGEYAGLMVIRKYHLHRNEGHRDVCLIPRSAHGTNPASAAMAGMTVVAVDCDANGNVDLKDLKAKAEKHGHELAAAMITYPSTHGVFEETITELCEIIHAHGGQVYMDGANMNAQVGLCRPGDFGPDVCHLNLHKTFCIPHGGGGPGMGPICAKPHLAPFLPSHPVIAVNGHGREAGNAAETVGSISAAPWGSPSILQISWAYIAMMGGDGLKRATEAAILNANYIARRLDPHYPVLYKGASGFVAHECIIDLRKIRETTGVDVEDVAKRLMDYGFHAPTISFPVPGTMMIEPTESESMVELDRFCEAMISIREEIAEIEQGLGDRNDNVLKNAPHTAEQVIRSEWKHPYSRERAAFPAPWTRNHKYWPPVSRISGALGDRNLVCACPPIDSCNG